MQKYISGIFFTNHDFETVKKTHGPAVYLLIDSKNSVTYVGQAKNAPDRLNPCHETIRRAVADDSRHTLWVAFRQGLAFYLDEVEQMLIAQYQPRYNVQHKSRDFVDLLFDDSPTASHHALGASAVSQGLLGYYGTAPYGLGSQTGFSPPSKSSAFDNPALDVYPRPQAKRASASLDELLAALAR